MRKPLIALMAASLALLSGCEDAFGDKDPRQPGTSLGSFHVVGTMVANSCGAGALGAAPTWEFDVDLAREQGVLFWDNGAQVVPGQLAEDGVSFLIEASVVVDMRTEETLAY